MIQFSKLDHRGPPVRKGRFIWPTTSAGAAAALTPAQLAMLLEGIDWRAPIRKRRRGGMGGGRPCAAGRRRPPQWTGSINVGMGARPNIGRNENSRQSKLSRSKRTASRQRPIAIGRDSEGRYKVLYFGWCSQLTEKALLSRSRSQRSTAFHSKIRLLPQNFVSSSHYLEAKLGRLLP